MTRGPHIRSRWLLLGLVVTLTAGLVWGVAGALADNPNAPGPVILRVGWTEEPDSPNPFAGINQSSYELYHISYDFLTNYGDKFLETQPGLAESWTSSNDGLTWTFKIREGVKWSDGQPLTAKDIAFSYNFQKKFELTNFLSALDGIKTAKAPDATTLVLECSKPKADILSMWVPVVPEHIWSKFKTYDEVVKFANTPPIVGSGPFQIVEWRKGRFVRCVANKEYWGGKPNVDELVFQIYTNQDTLAQDLKIGSIDLAINISPVQMKLLKDQDGIEADACAQKAFDYLSLNCYEGPSLGNPVLKDVKFRQALNWAIDKQKMTDLAYQGAADPGTSIFEVDFYDPELDWHWQPPTDVEYQYDPAKAKQILADAGYKDTDGDGILNDPKNGDKNITLRLWARTDSPQSQAQGRLLTGWWKDIGIDIKFTVEDPGTLVSGIYNFVGDTYKPDFDMFMWLWQPSGSDPGRRLGYFRSTQIANQNDCCWSNKEYDALWEQQSRELDPQKRKEIAWRMQEIFYTEAPYIVLSYPKLVEAWNTEKWQGWQRIPSPDGGVADLSDNVSNYYKIAPKTVASETVSSGSSTTWIIVVVAVAVVAVLAGVILLRRRPKAEEN